MTNPRGPRSRRKAAELDPKQQARLVQAVRDGVMQTAIAVRFGVSVHYVMQVKEHLRESRP